MEFRDPIIKQVVEKFVERSNTGFKKYGITLDDDKSPIDTWLNHLQEELMDAVNYIQKLRNTLTTDVEEFLIDESLKIMRHEYPDSEIDGYDPSHDGYMLDNDSMWTSSDTINDGN